MSVGPSLYPCTVDLDDGSLNLTKAQVFLSYSEATGDVSRVRVHVIGAANAITEVFDEPADGMREGAYPTMVHGRHQITLADGRQMFVMMERGGGCCGSARQLRNHVPGNPPTSGYRP